MSYRGVLDFTMSIDSFKNVGMFQQGVYFLTYQIYYEKEPNKKIYATPYANIPFIYSKTKSKRSFKNLKESEILLNEPTFKTRSFCIRYKHEEIPMNEVCQFRAEVDTDKNGEFQDTVFYIENKLYFYRFKFYNGVTQKHISRLIEQDSDEFKNVSTQTFRLNKCMNGMTEYMPTTFKGVYFSISHCILHTSLTNYKWREMPLFLCQDEIDDNGIYIEETSKLNYAEKEKIETELSILPNDLQDFLLGSKKNFYEKHKTGTSTIEYIFDVFVSPLIQNWENSKRTYETIIRDQYETLYNNSKPLSKIQQKCKDLEFCGITGYNE